MHCPRSVRTWDRRASVRGRFTFPTWTRSTATVFSILTILSLRSGPVLRVCKDPISQSRVLLAPPIRRRISVGSIRFYHPANTVFLDSNVPDWPDQTSRLGELTAVSRALWVKSLSSCRVSGSSLAQAAKTQWAVSHFGLPKTGAPH